MTGGQMIQLLAVELPDYSEDDVLVVVHPVPRHVLEPPQGRRRGRKVEGNVSETLKRDDLVNIRGRWVHSLSRGEDTLLQFLQTSFLNVQQTRITNLHHLGLLLTGLLDLFGMEYSPSLTRYQG